MLKAFTAPHLLSGCAPKTPILVALSGGADSVALLAILREYAEAYGTPLRVAHVNHGIRGAEALRDRDFCMNLAARWGIPLSVLDADVPALRAVRGGSLEDVARQVRYTFFAQVMEEYQIPLLATAHHADDQLETILLRLTRGTGADGLCGIPPIRSLGEGRWVIRPLLNCEKAELEDYCRAHQLTFMVDATNDDISYARNRIRHEVIPHLRAINPAVTRAAGRLSESLGVDTALLNKQAEVIWREQVDCAAEAGGDVRMSIACEGLQSLEEAIRRRVLMLMMRRAGCPQAEGIFVRLLSDMVMANEGGTSLSLPGNVQALLACDRLWMRREVCGRTQVSPPDAMILMLSVLPQTVIFSDFQLTFSRESPKEAMVETKKTRFYEIVYKMSITVALNSDTIKGRLFLRTRRAGDLFAFRGHHHKVKKLFCDYGVPQHWRDRLPLICDGDGIVGIPGIGVREGMHPTEGGRTLYISVRALTSQDNSSVGGNDSAGRI